ncbi:MAG: biotin/lipoyl-binding protein [Bryobacterales bacterium]|nr:biotin/lipoyl-binding protein [Bryobacterales bacterium]
MNTFKYTIGGNTYEVSIESFEGNNARVTVNGVTLDVDIHREQRQMTKIERPKVVAGSGPQPARLRPEGKAGDVKSPLPGVIQAVRVKEGDPVKAGQCLAILEAMKMENEIAAIIDGTVEKVHISQGQSVLEGDILVTIRG